MTTKHPHGPPMTLRNMRDHARGNEWLHAEVSGEHHDNTCSNASDRLFHSGVWRYSRKCSAKSRWIDHATTSSNARTTSTRPRGFDDHPARRDDGMRHGGSWHDGRRNDGTRDDA